MIVKSIDRMDELWILRNHIYVNLICLVSCTTFYNPRIQALDRFQSDGK